MRRPPPGTRTSATAARLRRRLSSDVIAVAPALGLFLGMALYRMLLTPTWVGDEGDDGAYFLMSRNLWHHGLPVLDQAGATYWSKTWSPGLSVLLSPAALLPMDAAVVVEKVLVLLSGVVLVLLAFAWMRRECALSLPWAAAGSACFAAGYVLVFVSSLVLSDAPAAAAILGGILLLRRGRIRGGLLLFALAAVLRPINVCVLAAGVLWVVLTQRRRAVAVTAAIGAAACLAVGAVGIALGGFRGYFEQFRYGASSAHGTLHTVAKEAKEIVTGGSTLPTPDWGRYVFPLLIVLAAVGVWRRRLTLEALVAVAPLPVLLIYPAGGFAVARYLLPAVPLLIGAVAVALASRHLLVSVAAAAAAAAAIAGYIHRYPDRIPSREQARAEVARRHAAYDWIDDHVGADADVVAFLDIQTFLYSHHPTLAATGGIRLPAYFVDVPSEASGAADVRRDVFNGFRTKTVFRDGDVAIRRLIRRP